MQKWQQPKIKWWIHYTAQCKDELSDLLPGSLQDAMDVFQNNFDCQILVSLGLSSTIYASEWRFALYPVIITADNKKP
jgi:hypothetical protein